MQLVGGRVYCDKYLQGMCWETSHQLKLKDQIQNKTKLNKPLRKKTFGKYDYYQDERGFYGIAEAK